MSINYNTSEYDKKYIEWLKEENRKLAEQLRWHPFAKEVPPEEKYYMVTLFGFEKPDIVKYSFENGFASFYTVIAWKELPNKYVKEEKE